MNRKFISTALILLCGGSLHAQAWHTSRATVQNEAGERLGGATATWQEGKRAFIADSTGTFLFPGVPEGPQRFTFSFTGFKEKVLLLTFPLPADTTLTITLERAEEEEEEEEVVVTATRISRTITNSPTRMEVISGEELEEIANMKPGDIRMMLTESTGIQTQQTSATSYNAGIRIQGLEGRYTQLLRDGYPLYSGFAGGLSILQIAPLDLRQVEVIKGSASTLYGGGAIAGLVNLVSKTPGNERELSFLANGTSAGGLDLSGFYSQRYGKAGLTLFASRNSGSPYDPAGIGLTAIPKFERYTLHPRLFLYGTKTTADIGVSYIHEDRIGGNMNYIKRGGSGFFEENRTGRITTQLGVAHRLSDRSTLQFKNSYTHFDRSLAIPGYRFEAVQQASFSELTLNRTGEKGQWVAGLNALTEDLSEEQRTAGPVLDYQFNTFGIFIQNAWTISDRFTLESGLRGDYTKPYGFELLPRVSALVRLSPRLTTRIGGGYGYKTPTVFTEETERAYFRNILPVDPARTQNERSVGGNWDLNYRTSFGPLGFSLNHLFFYTRLNRPLLLASASANDRAFINAPGHLDTKGMETNLRLVLGDFKLFVGYTYTDAQTRYSGVTLPLALTARHRLNNVLMFEIEEKLKLGLEGYYFSRQHLSDGTTGKPYWITGFMAEKLWERFSVYLNFENFTNTRQSRFDTIFTGSLDNPRFRDIYAPVEGFVVNGGIKLRL